MKVFMLATLVKLELRYIIPIDKPTLIFGSGSISFEFDHFSKFCEGVNPLYFKDWEGCLNLASVYSEGDVVKPED